ncbi:hypothetical protein FSP39_024479 [Pinctada imbricata]|uniref:Protein kinase domain-containing protein n=1 Tax=Pinctada imbricata TaxID=66713 RepID=A0AA89BWI7_PINIB|nr:hypothetical protein FSP39_024479 [Pinctada imbricata]
MPIKFPILIHYRIVSRGCYTEKDAAKAVKDMLTAVEPENLLYEDLTEDSRLKVADFGLSKILDKEITMHTVCGTPGYCAPEVLAGNTYTYAVDLWSIGVITYILLCGYEPFYCESERDQYKKILKADYQFDSADFVEKMLHIDPRKRLTLNHALRHPWVQGIAAKSDDMPETLEKIKTFNATRKMKALTDAAILATRVGNLTALFSQNPQQTMSDVSQQSVHEAMEVN